MVTRFASGVRQGWYIAGRSALTRIESVQFGRNRLLVFRDAAGRARVTDHRCPHLGADLIHADVTGDGLRCRFHGWCWGADGACTAAPGNDVLPERRLRTYATVERWGFVWTWLGEEPGFTVPALPEWAVHQITLVPRHVRAHPDTAFANGFDIAHFGPSHAIEARTVSIEMREPWEIEHRVEGRLSRRAALRLAGLSDAPLDASFRQYGGGIVIVHVRRPLEFLIVFAARPDAEGHTRAQTMVFLRRRRDVARALAVLWSTALDDIPLMETMVWTHRFAPSDAVLERYVRFIDAMPPW